MSTCCRCDIPTNAQSVSIGGDGTVSYVDAAGAQQIAGRLALAKFPNPAGLTRLGDNLWTVVAELRRLRPDERQQHRGSDRGRRTVGLPGHQRPRHRSSPARSRCRTSTWPQEFTQMITAQRGFQANSRVITTSDEMLTELVNLKR